MSGLATSDFILQAVFPACLGYSLLLYQVRMKSSCLAELLGSLGRISQVHTELLLNQSQQDIMSAHPYFQLGTVWSFPFRHGSIWMPGTEQRPWG